MTTRFFCTDPFVTLFADDTNVGGVADRLNEHAAIQRDLDRLEKCADRNIS